MISGALFFTGDFYFDVAIMRCLLAIIFDCDSSLTSVNIEIVREWNIDCCSLGASLFFLRRTN